MDVFEQSPRVIAYAVASVLTVGWLIYSRITGRGSGDEPDDAGEDRTEPRRRLPLE